MPAMTRRAPATTRRAPAMTRRAPAMTRRAPAMTRRAPAARGQSGTAGGRPVMLATLDVPFDLDAVTFAVDSAVRPRHRVVLGHFPRRAPRTLAAMLGRGGLTYPAA